MSEPALGREEGERGEERMLDIPSVRVAGIVVGRLWTWIEAFLYVGKGFEWRFLKMEDAGLRALE